MERVKLLPLGYTVLTAKVQIKSRNGIWDLGLPLFSIKLCYSGNKINH